MLAVSKHDVACRTIIDGFADKRFGIMHVNTKLNDTGALINGYRVVDHEHFRNCRERPAP